MAIYVKDNVERMTNDEETAKKLLSQGYRAVSFGTRVIPAVKPPVAEEKPPVEATVSVQRRRRAQRRAANAESE